ncbi:hypothetical protein B0H17DRAFT_1058214 [Mycena rosella]|uniref:F-box domain-containing protein n=1 Tax=Mycena rosella TaxID=1033263 RepID=A0AAD7DN87_MYCRO|nr:hypothetical protein B0H17DRAFT_1058214 [Mycena rosella]
MHRLLTLRADEPAAKRRKTATNSTKGKQAPATAKGKGKGRGGGILKRMLEMPMDVIYEIFSQSTPGKLVLLARVSKRFRAVLLAHHSSSVWIAARQNVSAPDPPSDMCEPAWANLLYTPKDACFECDKKTDYIDFALRRRLYLPCRKKHLLRIKPHKSTSGHGFDPKVFDLVPYTRTGGYFGGWSDGHTAKSYWRPDLEAMQTKVAQFQENIKMGRLNAREEYDEFVQTQSLEVETILSTVAALESWVNGNEQEQYTLTIAKKEERYNQIVDRLVAAGYSRDEVTKHHFLRDQKGVKDVRPLTDAAYQKIEPQLKELLDTARTQRVKASRRADIKIAYKAFLQSLVPIQKFFVPRDPFPSQQFMSRTPSTPKLPCIQQLLDVDPNITVSQEQFDALTSTSFFVDTSGWALERMKAIAEAASLSIALPPSVAWVTRNTPSAENDRRLDELGKIFDLATVVFVVDTWKSGSSIWHNWDHNWTDPWPSAAQCPDSKVLFIGRDAMNIDLGYGEKLVFSARGAEAVRAVLNLEHLDARSATASGLDARNSLFKCNHCYTPEKDVVYTWRGCAAHFINEPQHTQPSWSLVPAPEAASYISNGDPFPSRLVHRWMCNHCPDSDRTNSYSTVLEHLVQVHVIESSKDDKDLFYLPAFEECAPRILFMSRAA